MTQFPREPRSGLSLGGRAAPVAIVIAMMGLALATLATCGKTVEPGTVGVKIRTLGPHAGVAAQPLPSGWHLNGVGEHIVQYPIIQRTYAYTHDANSDSPSNEEISFADNTGLPMTGDIAITIQVMPGAAPHLYEKYRLSFDQLLDGPIRNDVRSAVAAETEKVGVEVLYSGGRQAVLQRALGRVATKWGRDGVMIPQLEWIGAIRYPQAILDQMQNKTRMEQAALAAKALQAQAEAEAAAKVAQAKGEADSIRIINDALAVNPQYIQLKMIEKWDGHLPQVTGGGTPFVNLNSMADARK